MMAPTHVTFAVLVGGQLGASPHYIFLLLGALFPDIDHSQSTLGRIIPLSLFVRHRTVTHSFLALGIALYVNVWFGIGFATHLLLDALNPAGVPILYPYEKRVGIGIIRTGSIRENILFLLICAGLLYKYI